MWIGWLGLSCLIELGVWVFFALFRTMQMCGDYLEGKAKADPLRDDNQRGNDERRSKSKGKAKATAGPSTASRKGRVSSLRMTVLLE